MAHHKSALKRVRQTAKRTAHNRSIRADLRTNIKKIRLLQENGNLEQAPHAPANQILCNCSAVGRQNNA